MTTFFDHVASASLPVAIGLLILAAATKAALWANVGDERVQRVAAQYLEPLATWSVIAALVNAVALGGSGALSFGGLAVAVAIAFAGMMLRPGTEQAPEPVPEPEPAAEPASRPPAGLWSR
jgi:peptidoglycan/LPS O-acetylase OafA/YrhL